MAAFCLGACVTQSAPPHATRSDTPPLAQREGRNIQDASAPDAQAIATVDAAFPDASVVRASKDFDYRQWLTDRGLVDDEHLECSTPLRVGVPLRDAVLCETLEDPLRLQDGRSLVVGEIFVADGTKLRRILRIPVGARAMHIEGYRPGRKIPYYVRVELTLSADGATIAVRDATDPEETCDGAAARLERLVDMPLRFVNQHRTLNKMVCDARGTYRWNGRALEKAGQPRPSGGGSGP